MMKRKVLLTLVLTALLLLVCGAALASEVDPIVTNIELDPARLAGPGTVNVTITVSNSGDTDLTAPVTLYDPAAKIVSDFGTNGSALLKAGETQTWTGTYDVNQRTLENGFVLYYVKYTIYRESGEAVERSQSIRGVIAMQEAAADMDVTRTITPSVAREGQEVTVKYDIVNSGTLSLLNVSIRENDDVNANVQTIPELRPGLTAEVRFKVTMGTADLTSGATITYQSENSSETQTYTVEDTAIRHGEPALTAELTSNVKGVKINDVLTLTLKLRNTGSVDLSDIRITDPTIGDVFANQQLAAGRELELAREITLTQTTDYQFTITATDSAGNETVITTDTVNVVAVDPEDALTLDVTITPDKTEVFESPGRVRFVVDIANTSGVDARNVVLLHGTTRIASYETLAAGESRRVTRDFALSMAGKYQFTVTAQDPLESNLTFTSNEVQIAFSVPTPAPATPTPAPNPTAEPTFSPVTMPPIRDGSIGAVPKTIQNVLLPILIVAAVLLLGSCVLLIIATKRRADRKKASEAAVDHLERAKRRDYVSPAEEDEPEVAEEDGIPAITLPDEEAEDEELPHMKYARSALSDGLYDEELTSGFDYDGYDDVPTVHTTADMPDDDDDGYTADLAADYEQADQEGYTDLYDGTYDEAADADSYEDVYAEDGAQEPTPETADAEAQPQRRGRRSRGDELPAKE